MVHVVLKLPIIKREELRVLFEVKQTGVKHGNGCIKYKLPKAVYRQGNNFYVLDSPMCSMVANVQLCLASINSTVLKMPCVTDLEGCEVEVEQCKTEIVQSVGGLLVRSDEEVRTSTLRQPDVFEREKPSDNTVMFYNYSEFADVLVGAVKIRGIQSATLESIVKLPSPKNWLKVLEERTEVKLRQNVSLLVETIERQENTMSQLREEAVIFGRGKWWVTPVVLTSLAIIGAIIMWVSRDCVWAWETCTKCCHKTEIRGEEEDDLAEVTYERLRRAVEGQNEQTVVTAIPEINEGSEGRDTPGAEEEGKKVNEGDRENRVETERKIYTLTYPEAEPARLTKPSRRKND